MNVVALLPATNHAICLKFRIFAAQTQNKR